MPARTPEQRRRFLIVERNQRQLTEIARLLDAGELQCVVNAVVPWAKASDAYSGTVEGGRGRGKTVLSVAD
jgi:NADPH:quinone reductase-like Zn-dependent oxidoreductase